MPCRGLSQLFPEPDHGQNDSYNVKIRRTRCGPSPVAIPSVGTFFGRSDAALVLSMGDIVDIALSLTSEEVNIC
ncbi:hypothetical protein BCR34DRAFT_580856 [Clohesyomyces aquaticus]|uniref:Uncharacterized protein n=1 Tax=Clohesyomyces aquaticus TaxID=1231657 RepID=A0A1Y1Y475_9PLEO|nr:hypothetical protein BCR34DRAFT_580856 [Clohesyomyces aquaticus]